MNALILAAGLGTRLRPLTDTIPKALVPLAGKPLIEHQIIRLREAGIQHIAVNVHHHAQLLIDYLRSHDFGVDIIISDERNHLLDTGGAIKQAARQLPPNQPLLVHNVDIFHHIPLKAFIHSHQPTDAATLLTTDRSSSRMLLANSQQQLQAWTNSNTGEVKPAGTSIVGLTPQAFSGIHILSPELIELMDREPAAFSIIDFYLRHCHTHSLCLQLHAHTPLIDVGKHDTLAQAEEFLAS